MKTPKLILIEGVPGSGKSTLAGRLASALNAGGFAARYYHEHDPAHPIMPPGEPGAMYDPTRRITKWTAFVDAIASSNETVILEGSLFQRQTNAYVGDLREAEAASFIAAVYGCVGKTVTTLVYFTQSEMKSHFEWLEEHRPGALMHFTALLGSTPFAARLSGDALTLVTSYFARAQEFTIPFAQRFPGKHCFLDGSQKDWTSQYDSISRCFGHCVSPS